MALLAIAQIRRHHGVMSFPERLRTASSKTSKEEPVRLSPVLSASEKPGPNEATPVSDAHTNLSADPNPGWLNADRTIEKMATASASCRRPPFRSWRPRRSSVWKSPEIVAVHRSSSSGVPNGPGSDDEQQGTVIAGRWSTLSLSGIAGRGGRNSSKSARAGDSTLWPGDEPRRRPTPPSSTSSSAHRPAAHHHRSAVLADEVVELGPHGCHQHRRSIGGSPAMLAIREIGADTGRRCHRPLDRHEARMRRVGARARKQQDCAHAPLPDRIRRAVLRSRIARPALV